MVDRTNAGLAALCAALGTGDPEAQIDSVQWVLADVPRICERVRETAWGRGPLCARLTELTADMIDDAILTEWVALEMTLRSTAGLAEHLAQLVNRAVLNDHFPISHGGMPREVIEELRRRGGFDRLANALEELMNSADFHYITDFTNTVKHRKLVAADEWVFRANAGEDPLRASL